MFKYIRNEPYMVKFVEEIHRNVKAFEIGDLEKFMPFNFISCGASHDTLLEEIESKKCIFDNILLRFQEGYGCLDNKSLKHWSVIHVYPSDLNLDSSQVGQNTSKFMIHSSSLKLKGLDLFIIKNKFMEFTVISIDCRIKEVLATVTTKKDINWQNELQVSNSCCSKGSPVGIYGNRDSNEDRQSTLYFYMTSGLSNAYTYRKTKNRRFSYLFERLKDDMLLVDPLINACKYIKNDRENVIVFFRQNKHKFSDLFVVGMYVKSQKKLFSNPNFNKITTLAQSLKKSQYFCDGYMCIEMVSKIFTFKDENLVCEKEKSYTFDLNSKNFKNNVVGIKFDLILRSIQPRSCYFCNEISNLSDILQDLAIMYCGFQENISFILTRIQSKTECRKHNIKLGSNIYYMDIKTYESQKDQNLSILVHFYKDDNPCAEITKNRLFKRLNADFETEAIFGQNSLSSNTFFLNNAMVHIAFSKDRKIKSKYSNDCVLLQIRTNNVASIYAKKLRIASYITLNRICIYYTEILSLFGNAWGRLNLRSKIRNSEKKFILCRNGGWNLQKPMSKAENCDHIPLYYFKKTGKLYHHQLFDYELLRFIEFLFVDNISRVCTNCAAKMPVLENFVASLTYIFDLNDSNQMKKCGHNFPRILLKDKHDSVIKESLDCKFVSENQYWHENPIFNDFPPYFERPLDRNSNQEKDYHEISCSDLAGNCLESTMGRIWQRKNAPETSNLDKFYEKLRIWIYRDNHIEDLVDLVENTIRRRQKIYPNQNSPVSNHACELRDFNLSSCKKPRDRLRKCYFLTTKLQERSDISHFLRNYLHDDIIKECNGALVAIQQNKKYHRKPYLSKSIKDIRTLEQGTDSLFINEFQDTSCKKSLINAYQLPTKRPKILNKVSSVEKQHHNLHFYMDETKKSLKNGIYYKNFKPYQTTNMLSIFNCREYGDISPEKGIKNDACIRNDSSRKTQTPQVSANIEQICLSRKLTKENKSCQAEHSFYLPKRVKFENPQGVLYCSSKNFCVNSEITEQLSDSDISLGLLKLSEDLEAEKTINNNENELKFQVDDHEEFKIAESEIIHNPVEDFSEKGHAPIRHNRQIKQRINFANNKISKLALYNVKNIKNDSLEIFFTSEKHKGRRLDRFGINTGPYVEFEKSFVKSQNCCAECVKNTTSKNFGCLEFYLRSKSVNFEQTPLNQTIRSDDCLRRDIHPAFCVDKHKHSILNEKSAFKSRFPRHYRQYSNIPVKDSIKRQTSTDKSSKYCKLSVKKINTKIGIKKNDATYKTKSYQKFMSKDSYDSEDQDEQDFHQHNEYKNSSLEVARKSKGGRSEMAHSFEESCKISTQKKMGHKIQNSKNYVQTTKEQLEDFRSNYEDEAINSSDLSSRFKNPQHFPLNISKRPTLFQQYCSLENDRTFESQRYLKEIDQSKIVPIALSEYYQVSNKSNTPNLDRKTMKTSQKSGLKHFSASLDPQISTEILKNYKMAMNNSKLPIHQKNKYLQLYYELSAIYSYIQGNNTKILTKQQHDSVTKVLDELFSISEETADLYSQKEAKESVQDEAAKFERIRRRAISSGLKSLMQFNPKCVFKSQKIIIFETIKHILELELENDLLRKKIEEKKKQKR